MTKLVLTRTSISAQVFPVLVSPAPKLSIKFFDKLTDILHGAGISVTNGGRQIEFDKKDRTRVVDAIQEMGWKQRAKIPAGMMYQLPGKEWIIRVSPTRLDLVGTKEISNPFAGDKGVTIEKAFDAFSVIVKLGANEKEANNKLKEIGFKNGKRDLLTVNHMYKNGTALIGAEQTDAGASSSPVKLPALKPAATRIEDAPTSKEFVEMLGSDVKEAARLLDLNPGLYPSGWASFWEHERNEKSPTAYPATLMKAILDSADREPLTDFCNQFYSRNRKMSEEANTLLLKAIEGDAKNVDKFIRDNYMVEGATNGLAKAVKATPRLAKALKPIFKNEDVVAGDEDAARIILK